MHWQHPDYYLLTYPYIIQKNYWGFIYRIDCSSNGRSYLGRKNFHTLVKTNNKRIQIFNIFGGKYRQSGWVSYYGSSKELSEDILNFGQEYFTRTILTFHSSEHELAYAEEEIHFKYDVLRARLPSGVYQYYNKNIGGRHFRKDFEPLNS